MAGGKWGGNSCRYIVKRVNLGGIYAISRGSNFAIASVQLHRPVTHTDGV